MNSCRRDVAMTFIRAYITEHEESPSFNQIARHIGIPTQKVGRILDDLERAGKIIRTRRVAKSIRLPERIEAAVRELTRLGYEVCAPNSKVPMTFDDYAFDDLLHQLDEKG